MKSAAHPGADLVVQQVLDFLRGVGHGAAAETLQVLVRRLPRGARARRAAAGAGADAAVSGRRRTASLSGAGMCRGVVAVGECLPAFW